MEPTFRPRPRTLPNPDEPIYDQGLAFDVETLLDRRQMMKLIAKAGMAASVFGLAACAPSLIGATTSPSSSASFASGTANADATCEPIPEETAGPFPGDGSNGPDVLADSGVVRSDIRSSYGSGSGIAAGVALTIRLAIQDEANACAPLAGAAVYVWHCDREGRYSMYSDGVTAENYLRGVQETGNDGIVTFTSIFPGCYSGRWPHVHFEVYPNLAAATDSGNKIATSQIAFPRDTCDTVYATDGYAASVSNLAGLSLDTDMVFGEDGGVRQLGTMRGDVSSGYTVDLAVPVRT